MSTKGGGIKAALDLILKEIEEGEEGLRRQQEELAKLYSARDSLGAIVGGVQRELTLPSFVTAGHIVPNVNLRRDALDLSYKPSLPKASELVLDQTGTPLGVDGLARSILRNGYPYDKSVTVLIRTLRGVLGRDIRTNPATAFVQPNRGLFALKKWFKAEDVSRMESAVVEEALTELAEEAA